MKILRGFVKGVIAKGTEQKPWSLVGIEAISKDRDGFEQAQLVKFMVAGKQQQEGLQNAYRVLIGSEVFAPYSDEIDEFNGKSRIRYSLQGIPLPLQEVQRERQTSSTVSGQQSQPAKVSAAS